MEISIDELLTLLSIMKEKTVINHCEDNTVNLSKTHYSNNNGNIGENLKKIRTEAGLTQDTLADKVGIGRSMLAQIERGTKALSLPLEENIAAELGCEIYDFLDKKGA